MKKTFLLQLPIITIVGLLNGLSQTGCLNIGVNLDWPQYWSAAENPFMDQIKSSGPFFTTDGTNWDTQVMGEITVDTNGYPTAGIPQNTSLGMQRVRKVLSAGGRIKPGQYVFLYNGIGTFSFQGGWTVDSTFAGRIVLTCTSTGNLWMDVLTSSASPNHVRDFRLVPKSEEYTFANKIFRDAFVAAIEPFYSIRFMDWMNINSSGIRYWSERTLPSSDNQSQNAGVCYEHIVELCNKTKKHPWVNVRHLADSSYIINMAKLFKSRLDTGLKIYLEYSNECWNGQFAQINWINQRTAYYPSTWPLNQDYDAALGWLGNYGKLANKVFKIWRNEFGADSLRVLRVLAGQAVNPYTSQEAAVGCSNYFDYVSPSWYFGISPTQANSYPSTMLVPELIDTLRNIFYSWAPLIKQHFNVAQAAGNKGVVFYEGGQHVSAYGNSTAPALQTFYDAQTDTGMYHLYNEVIDSLRQWGGELAIAYTLGGENSIHGSWGHTRSVDTVPSMSYCPKLIALHHNLPDSILGCFYTPVSIQSKHFPEQEITLFPNPNNGEFSILAPNNVSRIKIYDNKGLLVYDENKIGSKGNNINLTHFPNGIYYVIADFKNGITTQKMIIAR